MRSATARLRAPTPAGLPLGSAPTLARRSVGGPEVLHDRGLALAHQRERRGGRRKLDHEEPSASRDPDPSSLDGAIARWSVSPHFPSNRPAVRVSSRCLPCRNPWHRHMRHRQSQASRPRRNTWTPEWPPARHPFPLEVLFHRSPRAQALRMGRSESPARAPLIFPRAALGRRIGHDRRRPRRPRREADRSVTARTIRVFIRVPVPSVYQPHWADRLVPWGL